jgi:MinD superfamily P-loop ATPase
MSPFSTVVIPIIDYERCQVCRKCEAAQYCRFKAFVRFDREEPPYIEVSRCNGCGDCVPYCPYEAIVCPRNARQTAE